MKTYPNKAQCKAIQFRKDLIRGLAAGSGRTIGKIEVFPVIKFTAMGVVADVYMTVNYVDPVYRYSQIESYHVSDKGEITREFAPILEPGRVDPVRDIVCPHCQGAGVEPERLFRRGQTRFCVECDGDRYITRPAKM